MIGTTISRYKILEKLGEGGMGVVHKAEDTKLERPVALKFLPNHLLGDAEVKKRFEREAKAAAALDHANVCTVYEVDEVDGKTFIAMSLLAGESLDKRIARGPLKLDEALDIARQIAEGLQAAHKRGIIHRDIKPENIMVGDDGHVTVMDFGLAQLAQASRLTRADQTMGTTAYMSPEQTQGSGTDHRTDIWALGVVLYEMVVGEQPFKGDYEKAVQYSILNEPPEPITAMRTGVPMELEVAVNKALAKSPDERYQSVQELAVDLRAITKLQESGRSRIAPAPVVEASAAQPQPAPTNRLLWGWAAAATLGLLAVGFLQLTESTPVAAPVRFEIHEPMGRMFGARAAVISPDGRYVVSQGSDAQLWVRALDSLQARPLPGTYAGRHPFWSPDSKSIGFVAAGKLQTIEVESGLVRSLCPAASFQGASWASGGEGQPGRIIFSRYGSPLLVIPDTGGEPSVITSLGEESREHRWPEFLPDGRNFLFLSRRAEGDELLVASLDDEADPAIESGAALEISGSPARYVESSSGDGQGYLLFALDDSLVAQRFDPDELELLGRPTVVAAGVGATTSTLWPSDFSASRTGVLAFRTGGGSLEWVGQLAWFGRDGSRLESVDEPRRYGSLSLSPDESRIATSLIGVQDDIWMYDLERKSRSRFTFHPKDEASHVWSPDGSRLVFISSRGEAGVFDLYSKSTSGAGEVEVVLETTRMKGAKDWGNNNVILYTEFSPETGWDLWTLPMTGERKPSPYIQSEAQEVMGRFSPNGRWAAYVSNVSGIDEIYVEPYPADGSKWQISNRGGMQPLWRGDGKELFYYTPDHRVMAVDVETGVSFRAGTPVELFRAPSINPLIPHGSQHWEVSRDGQRFLIDVAADEQGQSNPVTVVLNWQAELERQ